MTSTGITLVCPSCRWFVALYGKSTCRFYSYNAMAYLPMVWGCLRIKTYVPFTFGCPSYTSENLLIYLHHSCSTKLNNWSCLTEELSLIMLLNCSFKSLLKNTGAMTYFNFFVCCNRWYIAQKKNYCIGIKIFLEVTLRDIKCHFYLCYSDF